jgi:hypothetical protein
VRFENNSIYPEKVDFVTTPDFAPVNVETFEYPSFLLRECPVQSKKSCWLFFNEFCNFYLMLQSQQTSCWFVSDSLSK